MIDKLVEILNAGAIWNRGVWDSRWCDSRHMRRRSTIAVVHCCDSFGKLVSLEVREVMRILWVHEVSRSSWQWCASALWQCLNALGSVYSELAAKFRIWHSAIFLFPIVPTRQDIVSPDATGGHKFYAFAVTDSSVVKCTVLESSVSVTCLLCIVSFLD